MVVIVDVEGELKSTGGKDGGGGTEEFDGGYINLFRMFLSQFGLCAFGWRQPRMFVRKLFYF